MCTDTFQRESAHCSKLSASGMYNCCIDEPASLRVSMDSGAWSHRQWLMCFVADMLLGYELQNLHKNDTGIGHLL